ncbi:hypothetical protein FHU30_001535 [Actinomadura rupiterrae]|nr:hypothetical protein [Actinomadura rupiterrae]
MLVRDSKDPNGPRLPIRPAAWDAHIRDQAASDSMNTPGPYRIAWRKSSHSSPTGSDCVEVGVFIGATVVRDSKDRRGPRLIVPARERRAFVAAIKERLRP